jgi:hypothetical protein
MRQSVAWHMAQQHIEDNVEDNDGVELSNVFFIQNVFVDTPLLPHIHKNTSI